MSGTVIQVVFVGLTGVMYGLIRLRVGSIVPLILLHGISDLSIDDRSVVTLGITDNSGVLSALTGAFSDLAPLFYAAFLYLRYRKSVRAGEISETPNLFKDQPRVTDAV